MLLQTEARTVASHGTMQVSRATVKATSKIFDFFASQTYSNKYLAIVRELTANAIDAHTAAGYPDRPVEVWLPNEFEPTFRCRDTGIGMSHDFVMNQFMQYTNGSTKDSSNEQIGGFGIGSKSPFSYVDQFTLRSVHDGILSIYSIFKDEDGIPCAALLSQDFTDEPNGVEVSFPVEPEDFNRFPEHPTYEQLAKMSGPWCCTVEEMAESWAELLDNIEATPSQDASALVVALRKVRKVAQSPNYPGNNLRDVLTIADAALTAWEAQHG